MPAPSISRVETFADEDRYTLEPGKVEIEDGSAQLITPETSGYLLIEEVYEAEAITAFSASVTTPGATGVKFQLLIDGLLYYWDTGGSVWNGSDGTYAQASSAANIHANAATAPINGTDGSEIQIRAVLSGTVTETPSIESTTIVFDYNAHDPAPIDECRVHLSMVDLLGVNFPNVTGKLWCRSDKPIAHPNGQLILAQTQETLFSSAYAELVLPETTTPNKKVRFAASYEDNGSIRQINFEPCLIPIQGSANLLDLTTIADDSE